MGEEGLRNGSDGFVLVNIGHFPGIVPPVQGFKAQIRSGKSLLVGRGREKSGAFVKWRSTQRGKN
jgi:hypothetical protein